MDFQNAGNNVAYLRSSPQNSKLDVNLPLAVGGGSFSQSLSSSNGCSTHSLSAIVRRYNAPTTNNNVVCYTTDGGLTWTDVINPTSNQNAKLTIGPDGYVLAVYDNASVFRLDGVSAVQVTSVPLDVNYTISAVSYAKLSGIEYIIVCAYNSLTETSRIYYTDNAGDNWLVGNDLVGEEIQANSVCYNRKQRTLNFATVPTDPLDGYGKIWTSIDPQSFGTAFDISNNTNDYHGNTIDFITDLQYVPSVPLTDENGVADVFDPGGYFIATIWL